MTKDEALRLALEALEALEDLGMKHYENTGEVLYKETFTAIKAALEAKDEPVEFFDWYDNAHWGNEDFKEGCHRAWNAAIKYTAKPNQEAKDEPVAWVYSEFWQHLKNLNCGTAYRLPGIGRQPLYTTQPQRKPLTDGEITEIFSNTKGLDFYLNFARAIEAAHGIKGEA